MGDAVVAVLSDGRGSPIVIRRAELADAEAILRLSRPQGERGHTAAPYPSIEMWRKRLTELSPSDFFRRDHRWRRDRNRDCTRPQVARAARRSIGRPCGTITRVAGGYCVMSAAIEPADGGSTISGSNSCLHRQSGRMALYRNFGFVIEGTFRAMLSRWAIRGFVRDGSPASGVQCESGAMTRERTARAQQSRYISGSNLSRYLDDARGFVGWRGMVGSVLIQRMLEEKNSSTWTGVFSTSSAGGSGPSIGRPPAPFGTRTTRRLSRALTPS